MIYLIALISSFCFVFLKGLQSQNVVLGHFKAAAITSMLTAVAEVGIISSIAHSGWLMLPSVMVGGTTGVLSAMLFHRRFIRGRADN